LGSRARDFLHREVLQVLPGGLHLQSSTQRVFGDLSESRMGGLVIAWCNHSVGYSNVMKEFRRDPERWAEAAIFRGVATVWLYGSHI
jgi:hypothetical protein